MLPATEQTHCASVAQDFARAGNPFFGQAVKRGYSIVVVQQVMFSPFGP
jgi:hypothetical protein